MNRLLAVLIGVDITVYAIITLGDCNWRETLSGAAYRTEQKGKLAGSIFRPIIDAIFRAFGEVNHCKRSHDNEVKMGIISNQ